MSFPVACHLLTTYRTDDIDGAESYRAGWYESEDLPRRYRRRLARPMGDQAEWNMFDAVYDSHYPNADSFTPTTSDPADRIFGRRMTSSSW